MTQQEKNNNAQYKEAKARALFEVFADYENTKAAGEVPNYQILATIKASRSRSSAVITWHKVGPGFCHEIWSNKQNPGTEYAFASLYYGLLLPHGQAFGLNPADFVNIANRWECLASRLYI